MLKALNFGTASARTCDKKFLIRRFDTTLKIHISNINNEYLQHQKHIPKHTKHTQMRRVKFSPQHHNIVSCNIHSNSCNIKIKLLQHQFMHVQHESRHQHLESNNATSKEFYCNTIGASPLPDLLPPTRSSRGYLARCRLLAPAGRGGPHAPDLGC